MRVTLCTTRCTEDATEGHPLREGTDASTLCESPFGKLEPVRMSTLHPTAFAVKDYLKRTLNQKESVKLTTADAQGRKGTIVIHRGEIWSARDTQGLGELALVRLMNERVRLHVEPLSELDRGPRTITDGRYVLFMRASFEAQRALEVPDDAPTCTRLPPPRDYRETQGLATAELSSRKPQAPLPTPRLPPPTTVTRGEAAVITPDRSTAPHPRQRGAQEDQQTAKQAPSTLRSSTLRPSTLRPFTLRPFTLETKGPSQTSSSPLASDQTPLRASGPASLLAIGRATRGQWRAAFMLLCGSTAALVYLFSAQATESPSLTHFAGTNVPAGGSPNEVASPEAREPVAQIAPDAQTARFEHDAKTLPDSLPNQPAHASEVPSKTAHAAQAALNAVVVQARAIGSTHSTGGVNLPRYVHSITPQFMRCYEWATARAGRETVGKVAVTVRLSTQGTVESAVATGAKISGLNTCIADVARRLPELMPLPRKANTLSWVVVFETRPG